MTTNERAATQRPLVLLVDDDAAFRKVYRSLLASEGYEVREASDRQGARSEHARGGHDVVLLDLMLPPDGSVREGLRLLGEMVRRDPQPKFVVVSGAGDVPHMVDAVRMGAHDFLTKPVDPDVLLLVVERAVARARLERQVSSLQDAAMQLRPEGGMIGRSPAFLEAVRLAERVATADLPVLITGESGTGKELMARMIHERSARASKPFVAVNCGAVPEALLESTLFGHVRGAFTGADRERKGLLAQADGGTVLLDEIGDMPASMQVKLLRTLESGEIQPVGKDVSVRVDVRVLSATHRDLDAMRREGSFRDDLYWRVCGAEVKLPALRERPSDIPLLAAYFLGRAAALTSDGLAKRLSTGAEAKLAEHDWPGNLRELRHEVQRATVLAGGRGTIEPGDLGFPHAKDAAAAREPRTLHEMVEALEKREIEAALARLHGNRSKAAEQLGLSRQGLLNKIARYGLG